MGSGFMSSRIGIAGIVVIALLALSLTAVVAAGKPAQGGEGAHIVSALGITQVQGQDVFVDVLVLVLPGQDPKAAVQAGLESQGARPLKEAELGSGGGFALIGPDWVDAFPVIQNYNSGSEPADLGDIGALLSSSQALWEVAGTDVVGNFDLGPATTTCPSLIRKCQGPRFFDEENTIGWLDLGISRGFVILGSVLLASSTITGLEADMALSTNNRIDWVDDLEASGLKVDVKAVIIHEFGHVLGLGHSATSSAVMASGYTNPPERDLAADDIEGITFLYDSSPVGVVSGTVVDGDGIGIVGATVVLEGTELSDTTVAGGIYSISGIPDPVTYTVTASKDGLESDTIDRLLVDGAVAADPLTLTAADGGNGNGGGGGGGQCPPNSNSPKCQEP